MPFYRRWLGSIHAWRRNHRERKALSAFKLIGVFEGIINFTDEPAGMKQHVFWNCYENGFSDRKVEITGSSELAVRHHKHHHFWTRRIRPWRDGVETSSTLAKLNNIIG